MYNILSIGKTGLKSTQNKMDAIGSDLANVNTTGYKKNEISFQELLVNEIYDNEVLKSQNVNNANINAGSKSGVGTVNFAQGAIMPSSGDFHMAISGKGFFGVRDGNGNLMLTRNGEFHINESSIIIDDSGNPVDVNLSVPLDQWPSGNFSVSANGEITGQINGQTIELGKIVLYNPEVLDSLTSLGEGRYMASPNVVLNNSIDQQEDFGDIIQRSIEGSNVEIVKSMADMIITQRAYSLNAKAIQSTDEIMSMINSLKR